MISFDSNEVFYLLFCELYCITFPVSTFKFIAFSPVLSLFKLPLYITIFYFCSLSFFYDFREPHISG